MGRLACRMPGQMEFHPVKQCAVSDRAGVGGPLAQGFPVAFPAPADVAWRDGGKGQQALAPAGPEQAGVPVPGIWCGSWLGDAARAEDCQQLLRAPQDHQPIIGVRGAPNPRRDVAAARPASVPKTERPDRFCPTV